MTDQILVFCMYFWRMADSNRIEQYRAQFVAQLEARTKHGEPKNLYEPIQYILGLGGKRLRPILTLMSGETKRWAQRARYIQ